MTHSTPNTHEYRKSDFVVGYQATPNTPPTVKLEGKMRLERDDEAPITELLERVINDAANGADDQVTLDLHQLSFMNSQGISVLFKFAINLRQKQLKLNVLAVKDSVWQQAHLNNIHKLAPGSTVTWLENTD